MEPLFSLGTLLQLGEEQVFTMFKAMAGDWSSAVTGFSEDVVIIGV